jgi:hypothetical protein
MNKDYYFLGGFYRSGNTVLSSILNQNPNIYSSPLSPVREYIEVMENLKYTSQNIQRLDDLKDNDFTISQIIKNYYSTIDKPIIIDRNKSWGDPMGFDLLTKYVTLSPKVVFTVRPILNILLSWINIFEKQLNEDMKFCGWQYKKYLSVLDNQCDFIMRPEGVINYMLFLFSESYYSEQRKNIHIVEYDELILNPQMVMNKIYNFLNLDLYDHDFKNIFTLENVNDLKIGQPENLHTVRQVLSNESQNPEDIFSDYVLTKYGNMEFWKNKYSIKN